MEPACILALSANFGSVDRWREAFAAGAQASAGKAGQMLLLFLPLDGRLVHQWMPDKTPPEQGAVPILAQDTANMAPSPDATAKVHAFIAQIDWAAAYARYQQAVHAASEHCGLTPDEVGDALVIDVRRAGVYEQAGTVIPGARWCDPATVGTWAAELPTDRAVVVYCVYGHEVSRAAALRLRAAGLNARFLQGGIDGWQAAGRPTRAKDAAP
jgi:Fe-Mn family superoxide dismutase